MRLARPATLLAALAVFVTLAHPAAAQGGLLERAKRKAKEAAEREIDKRTAETPPPSAAAPATPAASSSSASAPAASSGSASAAPAAVNVGSDFTPGTRVVYTTDFKRDELGDFPRAFELKRGNFEVADVGGTRYLRATNFGVFELPLPEVLPDQFTMEFDFEGPSGWYQSIYFGGKTEGNYVTFRNTDGGIEGPGSYRVSSTVKGFDGKGVFPVKIMADGGYVKVYMNGQRVANAPNANLGRSNKLIFDVRANETSTAMIGNIRIAAGGKDLYKALEESGRVTAEGIFFDSNSDRLRPESDAVLAQIGDMLAKHDDMRLAIEGHTDNVGAAAANLSLSEKRAAAVKAYLVAKHGIDAARLQSKGFGAAKPVAPNADESGRQKNRRVELVKL